MWVRLSVVLCCFVLSACGGGGGESSVNNSDGGAQTVLPEISIQAMSIAEGNGSETSVSLQLSLSATASEVVQLHYATADDTATAGSDYAVAEGDLSIPAGETQAIIELIVHGDLDEEDDERFLVQFSDIQNATLANTEVGITILNDDQASSSLLPQITITDAEIIEGDGGSVSLAFAVTLNTASTQTITLNYSTEDISANAASDYTAATNASLTIAAGQTSTNIQIEINGDTEIEADETFRVRLSNASNAALAVSSAVGTIIDDDAIPLPAIRIDDAETTEGDSGTKNLSFDVHLSMASASTVSIDYVTESMSQADGSDYVVVDDGTLDITVGNTTATLNITINGDTTVEQDEQFRVRLSNPVNATFSDNTAIGTIRNDDTATPMPSISINDVNMNEGDSGSANLQFTVSLSGTHTDDVTVDYATSDSTATSGSDYDETSDSLTITAGNTSGTFNVSISGDEVVETNEYFTVQLSDPVNATIDDGNGRGTINNDDSSSISIDDVSIEEGDSGSSNLEFTISLSALHQSDVTVDYATANDTATASEDYTTRNGTLTIDAGQNSATLQISINGDEDYEEDETFNVELSNASATTSIDDDTGVGTIENDDAEPVVVGYDTRPVNQGCFASGVSNNTQVNIVYPYPNIDIDQEYWTSLINPSWDTDKWFYTRLITGEFGWIDFTDSNSNDKTILMNLPSYKTNPGDEGGLLGMAFDPDFPNNGYVYFSFTELPNASENGAAFTSVIARYTLDTSTYAVVANSRLDILRLMQPYVTHNGGDIHFDWDGYLYIGFGDGGRPSDGHSQDPNNFLGAILRLDVSNAVVGDPYDIPSDNPFAPGTAGEGQGAPEVWAYGLRNPWRWNFDFVERRLWVADVGGSNWEEVDIIQKGGNYGWPCREGAHSGPYSGQAYCSGGGFLDPVAEFPHSGPMAMVSIAGGFPYRGNNILGLSGAYVVADTFGSGAIYAIRPTGEILTLADAGGNTANFGQDAQGELYAVRPHAGIYRLDLDNSGSSSGPATQLSQTGCVMQSDPSQPASGVIPFSINEPFWSDNAVKERFIALPTNTSELEIDNEGDFIFPVGSVLMKHFRLNGQLIETRLFMHQAQDTWEGFSYEWSGNDATLLTDGKTVSNINGSGQDWTYPSRNDCLSCHTEAAGRALGPELKQLNKDHYYTDTDRTANQLDTWEHIGYFDRALTQPERDTALTPSRNNPGADLNEQARSYLHSNCAQCHQGTGSSSGVNIDFRSHIALANMNICNVDATRGNIGITDNPKLLAPGFPERSVIDARFNSSNASGNRMPPLGSNEMDTDGIALINQWITELNSCTP